MLTKDRVIICKDYDEMSRRAADVFVDYIKANPQGILGLATGSSPEGIYSCLIEDNKAGKIVEWMEDMGYISSFDGAKARKVLITKEEFESKYGSL